MDKREELKKGENNGKTGKFLKSFVRRAKSMTTKRKELYDNKLKDFLIIPKDNVKALKQPYEKLSLEIGFGQGEALVARATQHPNTLFIGCEPHVAGIASVLCKIEELKLNNILLYNDDARNLLTSWNDTIIDELFVLFPDPWHKKRHHKRRLINTHFLALLSNCCSADAAVTLATDVEDYAIFINQEICKSGRKSGHFRSIHYDSSSISGYDKHYTNEPPKEWVTTRYESKALSLGSIIYYFSLKRV